MQRGTIYKHHGAWFLRYYDTQLVDGKPVKKRACRRLAPANPDYPTKRSVLLQAEKILTPINAGQVSPESNTPIVDFVEKFYLPSVTRTLRPSTVEGYQDIFKIHLRGRLSDVKLRDFRTVHGQRLMATVPDVGHKTLLRIKSFLSGVFTYARREGILDGENPMHGVSVPGRPTRFAGPIYTVAEIEEMLWSLPEPARTVVACAAFSGLRLSELRGLRWSDFDGETLRVKRTVWRTHVGPTKTEDSEAAVPVLPVLRKALEKHRNGAADTAYIFAGERRGAPLNLHNLARRVIKLAIAGKGVEWKGWHAFRRGLASNLYAMGVPPKVIQGILRHTNVSTTMEFYVQTPSEEARNALKQLDELFELFG